MFGWFKSSNESKPTQEPTWNATTMAMEQPSNAEAMSSNNVVSQQPVCSPRYYPLRSLLIDHLVLRVHEDGTPWWR